MNKINELKPGDESVVIEALINRVVMELIVRHI